MLIVKPYGKSSKLDKAPSRTLISNDTSYEIHHIATINPNLVIAQWISIIDKIIPKPKKEKEKEAPKQDEYRRMIGNAAWKVIIEKNLIPGEEDETALKKIWDWKISPFKTSKNCNTPLKKGKWYDTFVEKDQSIDVHSEIIAEKIYSHLYENQYSIKGDKNKPLGLIEHRSNSISRNYLRERKNVTRKWSKSDEETYKSQGDIAEAIYNLSSQKKPLRYENAVKVLYDHWPKIFHDHTGKVLNIKEASEQKTTLLDLHNAVKDYYRRTLKKKSKKKNISQILPQNFNKLLSLIEKKEANQNINTLIRIGKIIHYVGQTDNPASVDIDNSFYCSSEGQAQIKRNEAFVRIWRTILSHAIYTLKDWSGAKKDSNDITIENVIKKILDNYEESAKKEKAKAIFNRDDFEKDMLELALESVRNLRNSSFHFNGLEAFKNVLFQKKLEDGHQKKLMIFWEQEETGFKQQLKDTMRACHFDSYFKLDENKKIFLDIDCAPSDLSLPRFNKILKRAENTRVQGLPKSPNKAELEAKDSLRCQYAALKLLYERPFKNWLHGKQKTDLDKYLGESLSKATTAAQRIYKNDLIQAKAVFFKNTKYKNINDFFYVLSATMASEMRIQRAYESDPEKAKEQSGYIENLKCDVLIKAYKDFLKERKYDFILTISANSKPYTPPCKFDELKPKASVPPEAWQLLLFFVIHLVPVDNVNALLHQIRKWNTLAKKGADNSFKNLIQDLIRPLELYIARHDAKFTGGTELSIPENYKNYFEKENDYLFVFPEQGINNKAIPVRALREMQRFGYHKTLENIFTKHKIKSDDIEEYKTRDKTIKEKQDLRETLHQQWIKQRIKQKKLSDEENQDYENALQHIIKHRHLASRIFMNDFINLYRFQMDVLGRLVDYTGLFERDLYFVTLAIMRSQELSIDRMFGKDNRKHFLGGQVIKALRCCNEINATKEIENYFNIQLSRKNDPNIDRRNNFAHFNMLQKEGINLTHQINECRELMAYDRKLKNAVSKSIKELALRNSIELEWEIKDHNLDPVNAKIESKVINHMGSKDIREHLLSDDYLKILKEIIVNDCKLNKKNNQNHNGEKRDNKAYSKH